MSEYFKYFDKDNSDSLDYNEMRTMGLYLGISRKMMDVMILEIDVDKDNSISEDEWINYVLSSRKNTGKMGKNTVLNDL